ncbi:MAG: MBL fold metallo-hydrolase [Bacilli bacterium]|nr:MBL fold metallo-hydrolase [Bacilli bacterium]
MKYQIIASGSEGNLVYIEAGGAKVLIDAGISFKQACLRFDLKNMQIDAILVTHEHSDHVRHLAMYLKKTKASLYINEASFKELVHKQGFDYHGYDIKYIEANKKYKIKELIFMPLILSHDVTNCFGFLFVYKKASLAYITDTGFIKTPYITLLQNVKHLIIESNHDIQMLNESSRPRELKNRILSIYGHMSNITCGEVLNKILKSKKLECVTLAHLSRECNTPEVAVDTVLEHIEGDYLPTIKVAKQYEALEVEEISEDD